MTKSNRTSTRKLTGTKASPKPRPRSKKKSDRKVAQMCGAAGTGQPVARGSSKLASVIAMLRRPKGAGIEELCKATGWQAHSVRGAISGALKKRLGLTVTSVKSDDVRVYRVMN